MSDRLALPDAHRAASECSRTGQARYLRLVRARIIGLVVAALGGGTSLATHGCDISGWLTLVGFVVAAVAELVLLVQRPEDDWWNGRAAAESVKTLSWRYAVGGAPFPPDLAPGQADALFRERLNGVLTQMRDHVTVGDGPIGRTDAMASLRAAPFDVRRSRYVDQRARDQQRWYAAKAQENAGRGRSWSLVLLIGEIVCVVLAAVLLGKERPMDAAGFAAALAGGAAAWVAVKQHQQLAVSYGVAAAELAIHVDRLAVIEQSDWAAAVDEAEDTVSREHTLWRARRAQ